LIPLLRAPDAPASLETGYSAPEKLLGDDFSQRADVFSIGVLLWEAIEGKALFRNQSIDEVVTFLVGGKVSRPNVSKGDPWSAELAEVVVRALAVDPADRWENVGFMGADIETIAEGHMAKSYEVATLVTGRDVTRDSLSDELTTRISTAASLTPFANSIPSPNDGDAVPDSRSGTRGASTEPVVTSAVETGTARRPMPRRRARMIVTGALSLGALLLTIAGLKALTHATVSTSSANGIGSPAAAPFPEPARPEPIPVADPAAPAAAPNGLPEAEPTAPVASSGVHTAPAVPAQGKAARVLPRSSAPGKTGKPKDDPFGLLKPAKPKKDDDPFGL